MLGPGPRLMKKNLPDRGLTKVDKHCYRRLVGLFGRGVRTSLSLPTTNQTYTEKRQQASTARVEFGYY